MEEKGYLKDPLSYGVSAFVGNLVVGKLRVRQDLFSMILPYLLSNNLHYTIIRRNTHPKTKKNYVHFSFAVSYYHLNQIKIIVRNEKIIELQNEITSLNNR